MHTPAAEQKPRNTYRTYLPRYISKEKNNQDNGGYYPFRALMPVKRCPCPSLNNGRRNIFFKVISVDSFYDKICPYQGKKGWRCAPQKEMTEIKFSQLTY